MEDLISHFTIERLVNSALIILVSAVIYHIVKAVLNHAFHRDKHNKSRNTYIALVYSIVRYIYWAIVALLILQTFGFNISTMLAGVGLASAMIGLALQDTFKDIIRGISILSEGYLKLGDYAEINGYSGTVISAGIRSTKLRDDLTGNIITIANRDITRVEICANLINYDLPLPYELKLDKAEAIIKEIISACQQFDNVIECKYLGVSELGESAIKYRIFVKTKQERVQVKRDLNHLILQTLEKYKISVPYAQLKIHQ